MTQVEILIKMGQYGGLMGVSETLVLTKDGRGTADVGHVRLREYFEIDKTEIEELEKLLEAADIPNLPRENENPNVRDALYYDITYKMNWLRFMSPPKPLQPAFRRLVKILRDHGGI